MTAALPERIGRYRVREPLGAGGFATVYRAVDERLGVDVAVKVLAENHSLDAEVRARFVEEGRRLRRASGPHLVAVHDIGETERAQPYLVLDLADRGDLASRVAAARSRGRGPGPQDLLAVGWAVASALGVLHRQHIVHRDLAPKNLLLRSLSSPAAGAADSAPSDRPDGALVGADEQLTLADLGLSKDLAVASGLTVATGTSGFAPPEQRGDGGTVDHRADIWAASALVVWLALDRAPDDDGRWQGDLRSAGWSPELVRAMGRGLAPRPDDRYPTIDEWYAALERVLRLPALGSPFGGRPGRGRRRAWHRRAAALLMVVAASLGGAVTDDAVARARDGRTVTTTSPASGVVRTVVEQHGVTVKIDGPLTVAAGESLRLTANVHGAVEWAWVGPDGALVVGADGFVLEAVTAGQATVRIIATDKRGRTVEARRRLTVTASS